MKFIVSGSKDSNVRIYDKENFECMFELKGHT
jgi:hypothetical protein